MADQSKVWNATKKVISKSNPLLGAAIDVAEGVYKGISSQEVEKPIYIPDSEYIKECLNELKGKPKCFIEENIDDSKYKKFAKKFKITNAERILCIIDDSFLASIEGVVFTERGMYSRTVMESALFLSYKVLVESDIDGDYGVVKSNVIITRNEIKNKVQLTEKNSARLLYSVLIQFKKYEPPKSVTSEDKIIPVATFRDNELGYVGMIRTFQSQGTIEQNRNILVSLAKASNISDERTKEIENIIKSEGFNDNELGYVGMLRTFIQQGKLEENRGLLTTLASSSNISIERAREIEELIKR